MCTCAMQVWVNVFKDILIKVCSPTVEYSLIDYSTNPKYNMV